jgi:hypothetical protein
VLNGAVQRFWQSSTTADDPSVVLNALIERLANSAVAQLSSRAAWARMHDPALDLEAKIRIAKAFKLPAQRSSALEGLRDLRDAGPFPPKWAEVFLYDSDPGVRAAVFTTRLLERVSAGAERLKFYAQGLADPEAAVRLAVLQSPTTSLRELRAGLRARVQQLAESDESPDVRQAARTFLQR